MLFFFEKKNVRHALCTMSNIWVFDEHYSTSLLYILLLKYERKSHTPDKIKMTLERKIKALSTGNIYMYVKQCSVRECVILSSDSVE